MKSLKVLQRVALYSVEIKIPALHLDSRFGQLDLNSDVCRFLKGDDCITHSTLHFLRRYILLFAIHTDIYMKSELFCQSKARICIWVCVGSSRVRK